MGSVRRIAAIGAFAAGMLVALSTTASDLGIMSLVTLVVFAAKPLPPESAALSAAPREVARGKSLPPPSETNRSRIDARECRFCLRRGSSLL